MDRRHLALVAVLASTVACEKRRGAPRDEVVAKPAVVDVSRLTAPALFASVPAETPYMFAAFEAVPLAYYAKLKGAIGPALGALSVQLGSLAGDDSVERLMTAVGAEVAGRWDAQGLEALGFSASPRFALYGLGVLPLVFRIEVRDDKVVLATIERIAQRAGLSLPAPQIKDGRSYWRKNGSDDHGTLVALADKQLVFAFGRATELDSKLGLILGSEKPQVSMADGKVLKDLMTKHGFGPHLIGFVDTRKIVTQGMTYAGRPVSPACTTAIDQLGARVPRLVFGYSLLTPVVASGGAILELAPDLVTRIAGMRTEVPGLTEAMAGKPLLALGGGIQLDSARQLALEAAASVTLLGGACELNELVDQASNATVTLARPLPPPIASITGAVMVVHDVVLGTSSPVPQKFEGLFAVSSKDPKALFDQVSQLPQVDQLGIKADGKLHAVQGLPVPIPVHGGVGDRALVVGIGTTGKGLAAKALAARATGKAPFMLMSYDYGRFLELQSQLTRLVSGADPLLAAEQQLNEGLAKLLGRATGSLDVGKHGLAFWGTIEMK